MDPGLFAGIYILLRITHGVADYWLQAGVLADNKGKHWWALLTHILTYTLLFLPALSFIQISWVPMTNTQLFLATLGIAIPHLLVDNYKLICAWLWVLRGWTPESWAELSAGNLSTIATVVRMHVLFAFDQEWHKLSLAVIAAGIASLA